MLDRALKLIVTLTLLLFLLQAVIGVISWGIAGTVSAIGHTCSFLGSLLVAIAVTCFAFGLLVRFVQLVTTRGPRAMHERVSRDRAMRRRARRSVEGVSPHIIRREVAVDADPAVGEDEDGS